MTQTHTPTHSYQEGSLKETFESIVIAFILAFVFRAFVVEAFVIPTGSMAPTLLGEHVRVTCQECGYRFDVDVDESDHTEITRQYIGGREVRVATHRSTITADRYAICPMCRYPNPIGPDSRRPGYWASAGDRILVHKYIYSITEPRRWDVVVFKAPHDPNTNFIKRLVGLPGEDLCIIEGNIYVKPAAAPDSAWHIARKSDREKVQRAVWQPVYHSQYAPLDHGDPGASLLRRAFPWRLPWVVAGDSADQWKLTEGDGYRYGSNAPGTIRYDFTSSVGWPRYPYNQFKAVGMEFENEPMEDVRLAASVEPDHSGLTLTLSTTARWGQLAEGKPTRLAGSVAADGQVTLSLPDVSDPATHQGTVLAATRLEPLPGNQTHKFELWYVDQEASFWVDGRAVLRRGFELPMAVLVARDPLPPTTTPDVRIAVAGSPVTLHEVELDRDLYYSSGLGVQRALGGLVKHEGARIGQPVAIAPDQFFCMGDNSPLSHDSRYWRTVDPWISHRMFADHAITGMVPRELMLGRAFFVYWPEMYSQSPERHPFIPNIGDMRFIH